MVGLATPKPFREARRCSFSPCGPRRRRPICHTLHTRFSPRIFNEMHFRCRGSSNADNARRSHLTATARVLGYYGVRGTDDEELAKCEALKVEEPRARERDQRLKEEQQRQRQRGPTSSAGKIAAISASLCASALVALML